MWIIRGPIKPFIFSLFHLLHPDHPEQPDQSDHRFWLTKRIIKKIYEEPALVTLSCLIELQFGVNIESFSCQQKIKLFFNWYGQSGLKLQQKWSYLVKQIVMYLITCGNELQLLPRMPTSLPPQTEVAVTTTIEEGKITIPFKATFTTGLKEWWDILHFIYKIKSEEVVS